MKKKSLYHSDKVRHSLIVPASLDSFRSSSHRVWPESGLRITKCRTAWPVGKASPSLSGRWVWFLFLTHKRARLSRSLPSSSLWMSSTTADIVETSSVPSVRQGTPSLRPLKSQCACVRRASRSSKADFLFCFPPLISLTPLTHPPPSLPYPTLPFIPTLPFLFQWAEEGMSLSFLMCTIKDRPCAKTPTWMWPLTLVWRETRKGIFAEETPEPCDWSG